jgi:hypothetical protein
MENKTTKIILKALIAVIMVVGVFLGIISVYHGDTPGPQQEAQLGIIAYNEAAAECQCNPVKTVDAFTSEEMIRVKTEIATATDNSVGWSVILIYAAVIIGIVFNIVGIVKNPKGILKKVIMVGGFAIILLVIYFVTKVDEVPIELAEALDINNVAYSASGYNLASWGISASIVLLLLTVLSVVVGGVYSLVKK